MPAQTNGSRHTPAVWARLAAAAAACLLCWGAWWTARAGGSRVLSSYGVVTSSFERVNTAASLTPSDPEAHFARAWVATLAGDAGAAARAYEEAVRLRPRDHVLWLELGKVRERAGDTEGALSALREAARLAPYYAQPRWQLGNVLLRAGVSAEAFGELRRAAESDPSLYPNFIQTLWHAGGRDPQVLLGEARPRTAEQTLAVVRLLVREGAAGAGLKALRESGVNVPPEARRQLVAGLVGAGEFAGAYEVWSEGRGAVGSLADGGFEEGARSDEDGFGWRFARDSQNVRLSLDAAEPREGARSLKVEYAGDSEPSAPALSRLVAVEPGARYRLTFWARTKELVTGGPPFLEVASAAKPGGALAESAALPATSDGWREFALEFTAPAAGAVRVALRRRPCATAPCPAFGGVWLDAFELRRL
jgi:tetratricopeptide (TPR) repeat protein